MSKVDGRKVSHDVREAIRIQAIQKWLDGAKVQRLSKEYGTDSSCIYRWISRYRAGGMDALKTRPIAHSKNSKLTPEQQDSLVKIILTNEPTAYGFYKALWTRDIVAAVIKTEFDITMHPAAVSKMLRRIGLTPQRPVRKAWQQDEKKVREYLDTRYPALRKLTEESGAIIYFIDEASIRSDYHSGTTWSRRGITPTVTKTGARFGINMIAAVSGTGQMRYMTIIGRFNADVFIKFLKKIVNSHDCPVMIVTDGHSAHKAKKVMKYLAGETRLLEIHLLPPYSPELNPVELVWSVLKSGHIGRMALKTREQFLGAVSSGLKSLQRQRQKILGFFRAEHTAYVCLQSFHA